MKLRPFDLSMIEDTSMYDHLPYKRDSERCNIGSVALYSGNVVKYYRCSLGDVYELTDMDELAVEKIQEYINRERARLTEMDDAPGVVDSYEEEFYDSNELSDEQIAGLLGDKPPKKSFLGDYVDDEY